jgi:hypothetical protein
LSLKKKKIIPQNKKAVEYGIVFKVESDFLRTEFSGLMREMDKGQI